MVKGRERNGSCSPASHCRCFNLLIEMDVPQHPQLASLLPDGLQHHPVRIVSAHSMTNLISFALQHLQVRSSLLCAVLHRLPCLQSPESSPLLLHTLPPPPAPTAPQTSTQPSASRPVPPPAPQPTPTDAGAEATTSKPSKKTTNGKGIPTNPALSKIISIAEIVKRTYVAPQPPTDAPKAAKGKGKKKAIAGLHQYTYLGALEEIGLAGIETEQTEEERQEQVALEWITGGGSGTKRCVPEVVLGSAGAGRLTDRFPPLRSPLQAANATHPLLYHRTLRFNLDRAREPPRLHVR